MTARPSPLDVRRTFLWSLPLALLLGAFATVGMRIVWDEWLGAAPYKTYLEPLRPVDAAIWLGLSLVIALGCAALPVAARIVRRFEPLFRAGEGRPISAWWWFGWTAAMFLAWIPYLLFLWPGVVVGDSSASIGPMIGDRPLENHHPIAFTFFVGFFIRLAEALGLSINGAVALFALAQMAISSAGLAWCVRWFATRTSMTVATGSVVTAFFALVPVYPVYALNMQKDPLFALALLMFALHVADIALTRGAAASPWFLARFAAIALWASVWRNGGHVVVAATLVLVAVLWRLKAWKPALAGIVAVGIGWGGIQAFEASGVKPAETAESLAIPMQQVARVVYEERPLTESEHSTLDQMLPVEKWAEVYSPARVDAVKWDRDFSDEWLDENAGEFLAAWASIGTRNLDAYVDAWILETFGFWAPGAKNFYGSFDTGIADGGFGIERAPRIDSIWGMGHEEFPERYTFFGSGTLVWVLLIAGFAVLMSPRRRLAVALSPFALMWLAGLAATPAAFGLRYVYAIALALPFLVLLPVLAQRRPAHAGAEDQLVERSPR